MDLLGDAEWTDASSEVIDKILRELFRKNITLAKGCPASAGARPSRSPTLLVTPVYDTLTLS
jgi:hypothetical protein